MGILGSVFGGTYLATRGGGAKEQQKIQQGPPVAAGSKDEEDFIQYVLFLHLLYLYNVINLARQELPQVRGRRRQRAKVPAVNLSSSIELLKAACARGGSP